MKGIYRKALLFGTLIGSLTFSFPAVADEQFIELGVTKSGEPVFLNTESIRGSRFAIFMAYGNGMMRLHYSRTYATGTSNGARSAPSA